MRGTQRSLFDTEPSEMEPPKLPLTARGQQTLFGEPVMRDMPVFIARGVHAGRLGRVLSHRIVNGMPVYSVETVHGSVDEHVPHSDIVLPEVPIQWEEAYPDPFVDGRHVHPKLVFGELHQIAHAYKPGLTKLLRAERMVNALHSWYKNHPTPRKALQEMGTTGDQYRELLQRLERHHSVRPHRHL